MAAKTKAVLDAAEKTLEAAEPVLERVESELGQTVEAASRIPKLWLNGTTKKQQILILSITALGGAAAGTAVSMTVLKKKLRLKYEELAAEEIADAKEFYANVSNKPDLSEIAAERLPKANPSVEVAAKAVQSYGGHDLHSDPRTAVKVPDEVTNNIFVEGVPMGSDVAFDYEAEIAQRSETEPYIISKDEFGQNEKEYEQVELTYYEGDDVLADDKQKHIPDADDVAGDLNLHRFGHGSGDNNILYVRNDRLEQDYVIVKSLGEYSKEVLGLRHSDEGRHAGSRKQRRYRGDDG
jgi:hypothetical protein